MAVYEVFTQQVCYRYKSTLCSKASVVIAVITLLTTVLPLIISYRSNGFWLKTASFQEQPEVKFMHNYLLVLETDHPFNPVFCGAQIGQSHSFQRHCTFKSRENDVDRDGKVDHLQVNIKVPILLNESVYSLTLLIPLEVHLDSMCHLQMQALAIIQYNAALPGAHYSSVADLRFVQRKPLTYRSTEVILIPSQLSADTDVRGLLSDYAQRNYSTSLVNRHDVWITGRSPEEPFTVSLGITFPENTFMYHPGFWQIMKWAWMQYLSVLIVFIHFFQILKEYIFSYQLVPTRIYIPWKT